MTPLFLVWGAFLIWWICQPRRKTLDELRAADEEFMALLSSGQAWNRTRELREWNEPEDSP